MSKANRRNFIKSFAGGVTGSLLFSGIPEVRAGKGEQPVLLSTSKEEAYWSEIKEQYRFASGLKYFNNASLGASPIPVQEATRRYRDMLDGFPSKYMWGGWNEEKEAVREQAASLLGASPEEIALIHNTTEGMNLIARSFDLQSGDEVILADHEHTSGTIPWKVWQEEKGVKLVRPTLPIIPGSVDELVECYRKAITPKTRIISMCHMVNTNGMMLPVKEVSEMAHEKDILVAVDGAQTAGMFQFNLHELGCDFYAASSHKWLFSPKGVGMLYAKQESQYHLKPLVVCRGYDDPSIRRLENYNTRNLPEVLGLGAAIQFIKDIGIAQIHQRSYELKKYFRSSVEARPQLALKTPGLDELSAAIQVVEVKGQDVGEVKAKLFEEYGIDCRPMSVFGLNGLRISLAVYNTKADIEYLVTALGGD